VLDGKATLCSADRTRSLLLKCPSESKARDGYTQLIKDLKKTGVRGRREIAKDRHACKLIPKESRVLHGQ
jgi:hypothetical protein